MTGSRRGPETTTRRPTHLFASELEIEALRQSEAKYRRLHETRIDAFVSVSMDGRIQEFNDLFPPMVGYEPDELRALTYQDLTPVKWHAFEASIVETQVLVRGHSNVYEKEYRRKDGTIFPVELRTVLVRGPGGAPAGMWAAVRDVTSRKRAEAALAAAREELLALINSTGDLIWSVDPQVYGLVTFNEALRRYFADRGIAISPGMTPADLLPQDFAERWREFYRRVLGDGPFVERYVTASGTRVLLLSFNLVKQDGTVTGISVFGKDITGQLQTEERFRQVAETVTDFIWEVDADGLYTYTNPAVEKILGYTPAELVGRKYFYDFFADEVREDLKRAALEAFATQQPFRSFPNLNVRKDGRLVQLETSGVPLVDAAGRLLGYRGADTDVTERWQTSQAMQDLAIRLINAQEEERARLAGELHDDFSQRLALLAIRLDLLGQSPPARAESLRESVKTLCADVNALATDVHRMSHALHPARLAQLGVAAAIGGLCRELTAAHAIAIRFDARDVPRDVPPAVALCLYRVAQEALHNVVKHSGASAASVSLAAGDGELHLAVEDEGRGFDVAAAHRDSLGLANMRERVRSVGGRLEVSSAPGRGTRIEVNAPLFAPA